MNFAAAGREGGGELYPGCNNHQIVPSGADLTITRACAWYVGIGGVIQVENDS